jgi:hypothetical protein
MNMPGFAAEASLAVAAQHYCLVAGESYGDGRSVVPQQFVECRYNRSCWGVVLMCRDHCTRYDGSTFSSLWYACGVCIGLFEENIEIEW